MSTSKRDGEIFGKRFSSLYAKLNILTISIIILTVTVISTFVVQQRLRDAYSHLQMDGIDTAKMVASVSEYGIYTENVSALREIARSLKENDDNAYLTIYNKDRQILLDTDLGNSVKRAQTGIPEMDWGNKKFQTYKVLGPESKISFIEVIVPVLSIIKAEEPYPSQEMFGPSSHNEIIGYIQLGIDQKRMHDEINTFLWSVIAVTTVISVVGILVTILLTRRIVSPIDLLLDGTKRVAEGDFEYKVAVTTEDEIGKLARAYNDMIDRLGEYQSLADEARNNLEKKVQERTAELEETTEEAQILANKAEQASRAKSEFLATMSHEIRTPMNGVLGMIDLLLSSDLSGPQKGFAQTVRSSGETLLGIINDVLDFSKIEAGKLSLEHIDFNLRDLIEDQGQLFALEAHSKGIELACMIPSDIPVALIGDPGRLRQVVGNLVGNAIKFTDTGEILINVKLIRETESAARVKIEVRDTGIGLKPEQLKLIFESFAQADGSTTRKYGGTGLGLSISRRLIALMGGELSVTSIHGQGSIFWLELDLEKQHNSQTTVGDQSTAPVDFSDLNILVVDDNRTNLEILDHHLNAWNVTHTCCDGGTEALKLLHKAILAKDPFNLIILDNNMPGMSGIELARIINSDGQFSGVKVVMYSSVDDVDTTKARRDFGIDYFITKPVRQCHLYDCLNNKEVSNYHVTNCDINDALPTVTQESEVPGKILLVEDNKVNQTVATAMLRKLGYDGFDVANNGSEALDKLLQTDYDVVLMDIQMPVMDGYEATAALREHEQTLVDKSDTSLIPRMPVIALTANTIEGDRETCLAAGVDDYLTKPYTSAELREVLHKWLPQNIYENQSMAPEEYASANETAAGLAIGSRPGATSAEIHLKATTSIIDQNALDVIRDMEDEQDPDFLAEIIGLYLRDSAELLDSLQAAIAEKNTGVISSAAHTLKSTSNNLGALTLAKMAKELEELGRGNSLDNVDAIFSNLHIEYQSVTTALREELKEHVA